MRRVSTFSCVRKSEPAVRQKCFADYLLGVMGCCSATFGSSFFEMTPQILAKNQVLAQSLKERQKTANLVDVQAQKAMFCTISTMRNRISWSLDSCP